MKRPADFIRDVFRGNNVKIAGDTTESSPLKKFIGNELFKKIVCAGFVGILSFGAVSPAFAVQYESDVPLSDNVQITHDIHDRSSSWDRSALQDGSNPTININNLEKVGTLAAYQVSKLEHKDSQQTYDLKLIKNIFQHSAGNVYKESYLKGLSNISYTIKDMVKDGVIHDVSTTDVIDTIAKKDIERFGNSRNYKFYSASRDNMGKIMSIQAIDTIAIYSNLSRESVVQDMISHVLDGQRLNKMARQVGNSIPSVNELQSHFNEQAVSNSNALYKSLGDIHHVSLDAVKDIVATITVVHEYGHVYLQGKETNISIGEGFADFLAPMAAGIYAANHADSNLHDLVDAGNDYQSLYRLNTPSNDVHVGAVYTTSYLQSHKDVAYKIAETMYNTIKKGNINNQTMENAVDMVYHEHFNKPDVLENAPFHKENNLAQKAVDINQEHALHVLDHINHNQRIAFKGSISNDSETVPFTLKM